VQGLLLDGERKSVQPMAARLVKTEIEVMRQRLQQCVVVNDCSDDLVRARLARRFSCEIPGVEAFVIDDTGFPKKGTHSVGVARQCSGTLGRVENCQVATNLHLAAEGGSACIGMQMYMPKEWSDDPRHAIRPECRRLSRSEASQPSHSTFLTALSNTVFESLSF